MTNHLFKNYIFLPILTAGFLLVLFFAAPHIARAVKMENVLKITTQQEGGDYVTDGLTITIDGYGSVENPGPKLGNTSVDFKVFIELTGEEGIKGTKGAGGYLETWNNGKIEKENNLGGWDAFYDDDIEDKSDGGIRIMVEEKPETGDEWKRVVSPQGLAPRLKQGDDSSKDVSENNPQLLTGNKIDFYQLVTGLEGGKTYRARIIAREEGTYNDASSRYFEFTAPTEEIEITPETAGSSETIFRAGEIDFDCSLASFSLKKCYAAFLFNGIFWPVHLLTKGAAFFLDFLVGYAIDDNSYRAGFVERGWGIVRDIANIGFIFALIYVAFRTILGLAGGQTKKMIATLIVAALLINFSLFFTRVIIDVGNSLAHVFYNSIEVKNPNTGEDSPPLVEGRKNVALALVSKISIGSVLSAGGLTQDVNFGWYLLAIILVIVLEVLMIYVFFSVGLLFVGRVIGLWFSMIFAPVAFMSYALPEGINIPNFGHKDWWSDLLKQTFMAPLFIFFLYLIVMYLESPLSPGGSSAPGTASAAVATATNSLSGGQDFTQTFMGVVIPFAMMVVLIFAAKKVAVDFSGKMTGQINKAISGMAKTAVGVAGGVALGGAALAMRGTVGKFAAMKAADPDLQKRALAGDKGAQRKLDFYGGLSKKSFDARSTMLGKGIQEKTGMKFGGSVVDLIGAGEKSTQGGFRGAQERKVEKTHKEFKEKYALTDAGAAMQDKKSGEWETRYREALNQAKSKDPKLNEREFREKYEKGEEIKVGLFQKDNVRGEKRAGYETADEVNAGRRVQYAQMKSGRPMKNEDGEDVNKADLRGWWKRMGKRAGAGLGIGAAYGAAAGGVGVLPGAIMGGAIGVTLGGLSELKNIIGSSFKLGAQKLTEVGVKQKPATWKPNTWLGGAAKVFADVRIKEQNEVFAKIMRGKSKKDEFFDKFGEFVKEGEGGGENKGFRKKMDDFFGDGHKEKESGESKGGESH